MENFIFCAVTFLVKSLPNIYGGITGWALNPLADNDQWIIN